jgi:subtilisin family serine protease
MGVRQRMAGGARSRGRLAIAITAALLLAGSTGEGVLGSPAVDEPGATPYVVLFADGTDVDGRVDGFSRSLGVRASHTYRHAVRGFAARLSARQLAAVQADPTVTLVQPDRPVELTAQVLPTGINRIDAELSPTARINGVDERVDADIAIIDTGIQPGHPDLNVAGGYNCVPTEPDWNDGYGHGTHVAGIAGALDNGSGVVGVAPGARLWAVRVFDRTGFSLLSWIVCGIDWVTGQRDPSNSAKPRFEAANMSLRDAGTDDGNCGYSNGDAEHRAICASVASGVTYAVSAGNDRTDSGRWIPAAYPEVITVSALADLNGQPGGGGPATCYSFGSYDEDDTFANFSNFGPAVDLIAPGKCIYSTYPTTKIASGYHTLSGTSMAAPHVAGAIALYKVLFPSATPAQVRDGLRAAATYDWITWTDFDGLPDKLLNVWNLAAFPPLADFTIGASPSSLTINQGASGTSQISTTVVGGPGTVSLAAAVAPAGKGVTATLGASSVAAGGGTTLTVNAASGATTGSYTVTVTGTEGGIVRSTAVAVTVTVPPAPDFTISASPGSRSIRLAKSSTASYTVNVNPTGGFAELVALSVQGLPAGASATFSPTSTTTSSVLRVTVSGSPKGTYRLTITGVAGGLTRTTTVTLAIR